MLILSRKPGTSISIGEDINITFIGSENGVGKIGIDAPTALKILRDDAKCTTKKKVRKINIRKLFYAKS